MFDFINVKVDYDDDDGNSDDDDLNDEFVRRFFLLASY